jgi:23S rRNA pseudouridine1911/1915/1917 synthase
MADAGHPLLGDTLYGGSSVLPVPAGTGREISSGTPVPRTMLHAAEVRLLQPFTGEQLHVTAPFPEDFGSLYREFGIQVHDNGQQTR